MRGYAAKGAGGYDQHDVCWSVRCCSSWAPGCPGTDATFAGQNCRDELQGRCTAGLAVSARKELRKEYCRSASTGDIHNATLFGGKAWDAVNSYATKGNGRTATHDRSGVRDKKFSPGEGDVEEGVGDRTTADDAVFCIKGIGGKRPSAAAMYEKVRSCGEREMGRGGAGGVRGAQTSWVPAPSLLRYNAHTPFPGSAALPALLLLPPRSPTPRARGPNFVPRLFPRAHPNQDCGN